MKFFILFALVLFLSKISISEHIKKASHDKSNNFLNSFQQGIGSFTSKLRESPKSTNHQQSNFLSNHSSTNKDAVNRKGKQEGFIDKVWKSLMCFLFGIFLWFGSIYLICYFERMAVKEYEFLKVVERMDIVEYHDLTSIAPIPTAFNNPEKIQIITGTLSLEEFASIPYIYNTSLNNMDNAFIHIEVEKYYEGDIKKDDGSVEKIREWRVVTDGSVVETKTFTGNVND